MWLPVGMDPLYPAYRKWRPYPKEKPAGIIVGSDLTQEWLLPWWWEKYRTHNDFPVTFVDFGMSKEKRAWCQERGELILLPIADIFVAEKEQVDPTLIDQWEGIYGGRFWPSRSAWFKKPLACLQSPYKRSIWIDLDCEIRGSIKELFSLCEGGDGMALAEEGYDPSLGFMMYNSGVIIFKRSLSAIESWAHLAFEANHAYAGDQDLLSKVIHDERVKIMTLSPLYNWSRRKEKNPDAIIYHWHGQHGKSHIAHEIASRELKGFYPQT